MDYLNPEGTEPEEELEAPAPAAPVVEKDPAKSLGILEKKQLVKVIEDRYDLIEREIDIQAERVRNQILDTADAMNSGDAKRLSDETLALVAQAKQNSEDLEEVTLRVSETYRDRLDVLREELRSLESSRDVEVNAHREKASEKLDDLEAKFALIAAEMEEKNLKFEGYGIASLNDARRTDVGSLAVNYERGGINVKQKMRELGVDENIMKHELRKQMQSKIEVVALGGINSETKAALLADIPDPMDALPSQARVKEIASQL